MRNLIPSLPLLVLLAILLSLTIPDIAQAAVYVTNSAIPSASDTNPGSASAPFRSVQRCVDALSAGDTCEIRPGIYNERPRVLSSGTAANRIVLKGFTGTIIKGVRVDGSYVRVEGFEFTGAITGSPMVEIVGDYVEFTNNHIYHPEFTQRTDAIWIKGSYGILRNNRIENWPWGTAFTIMGAGTIAELNTIRDCADMDAFRLFGHDHLIRRNLVLNIVDGPQSNHIDFVQTFGQNGDASYNMRIEENFVKDIPGGQLSQLSQCCGIGPDGSNDLGCSCASMPEVNGSITARTQNSITDQARDWIQGAWGPNHFAGAVLALVSGAATSKIYLIASHTDTTMVLTKLDGSAANLLADNVAVGDQYEIRMRVGWWTFRNNFFMNMMQVSNNLPHMQFIGNTFVNFPGISLGQGVDRGRSFHNRIVGNVHIDSRSPPLYSVPPYLVPYFFADYNYEAYSPPTFGPRRAGCPSEYTEYNFCETQFGKHGINGGDPLLANFNNPLGADGVAFSDDDGFRPANGSLLCGAGPAGADIGAHTCLSSGTARPAAPSQLRPVQ
jgi:hypothetical protein